MNAAIGLAARHPLRPGQLLYAADLMKPQIVQRNDTVTLTYEAPGLMLTLRGQAQDAGALGDTIGVLNPQTKRVVQGVVSGPGRVSAASTTVHLVENTSRRRRRLQLPWCRCGRSKRSSERPVPKGSVMSNRVVLLRCALLSTVAVMSASCSTLDQLQHLGQTPPLSPVQNPTTEPGYKPVQMPMPTPQPASYNPNSLWRNGSRAFFNDQRAHQVGDILTVKVNINDTAEFQDQTQLSAQHHRRFQHNEFHRRQHDR